MKSLYSLNTFKHNSKIIPCNLMSIAKCRYALLQAGEGIKNMVRRQRKIFCKPGYLSATDKGGGGGGVVGVVGVLKRSENFNAYFSNK